MGGDSVDPVIAGAYAFGARDFDARAALAAMVKGASTTAPPPAQGWYVPRWELDDAYLQHGYVVNTHTTSVSPGPNGASETLEYALDDFSIARLAFALHDAPAYAAFMRRSANWMTLFDSAAHRIAPRDSDGAFMYAPITENGQSGFQEGNAAQYSWMVPQDLRDLIAALGGAPAATAKLDEFFSQLDAGQDKPYAWLGNEPSLGTPWVYLSAGEPWRAQAIVRQALTTLYDDTPDGLPGNDDLGTMSAWYVWCAIGLYPQNPAVGYLDIGAPLFSSVTVRTPNGPVIEIAAPQSSPTNAYVEQLRLNGRTHDQSWIGLPLHGRVRLDVAVGARPNAQWASGAGAAPPSFATMPLALPPATATIFQPTYDAVSVAAGGAKPFRVHARERRHAPGYDSVARGFSGWAACRSGSGPHRGERRHQRDAFDAHLRRTAACAPDITPRASTAPRRTAPFWNILPSACGSPAVRSDPRSPTLRTVSEIRSRRSILRRARPVRRLKWVKSRATQC